MLQVDFWSTIIESVCVCVCVCVCAWTFLCVSIWIDLRTWPDLNCFYHRGSTNVSLCLCVWSCYLWVHACVKMSTCACVCKSRAWALTSVAVVIGIAGHHSPSMQVGRQHEPLLLHPVHDCQDLKLASLLVLPREDIRKVPVEVHAVAVVPAERRGGKQPSAGSEEKCSCLSAPSQAWAVWPQCFGCTRHVTAHAVNSQCSLLVKHYLAKECVQISPNSLG